MGTPLTYCGHGHASGCARSHDTESTAIGACCLARQNGVASENMSGDGNPATLTACDATGAKIEQKGKQSSVLSSNMWCDNDQTHVVIALFTLLRLPVIAATTTRPNEKIVHSSRNRVNGNSQYPIWISDYPKCNLTLVLASSITILPAAV